MAESIYNKLIFGKYKLVQIIGKGSFGFVLKGKNIVTGENVAVKIEEWKKKGNILEGEAYFLFYLKGVGIPEVKSFGVSGKYKILVETLLGDSLETIFNKMKYRFTLKDVCMIALQVLDRLEFVHSKYIIHRDIKPDNIMVDFETKRIIYLIDFGLSKKYRSARTGRHIKFTIPRRLTGTARYASVNALRGTEQSRRDDLESVGYVLIYFVKKGDLPWIGLNIEDKIARYKKIYYIKRDIKLELLCSGIENEFLDYIKYVRNLNFEQTPNYGYLKGLFMNILNRSQFFVDYKLSWLSHKEISKNIKKDNNENNRVRNSSLTRRKSSPQMRILKNIQTSKERENNLKVINESKLLTELEEKQEQREKEFILKRKYEKEKQNNNKLNLDINNISTEKLSTQMAIYNLSLNMEDVDEESKLKNKTNINNKPNILNNRNKINNNIKKISLSEKESKKNIKIKRGEKLNNNTHKNRPIIFNLSNGSFNNATLVKCLSQYNVKINSIEKIYNSRNNRTSIKSPKLTEEFIQNNIIKIKKGKNSIMENKNKDKTNININNIKSKSSNVSSLISPDKTQNSSDKNNNNNIKLSNNKINKLHNKENIIINSKNKNNYIYKIKNTVNNTIKNTNNNINNTCDNIINNNRNLKIKNYISPIKDIKNKINNKKIIKLNQNEKLKNSNSCTKISHNISSNNLLHNNISRNLKRINLNQINNISSLNLNKSNKIGTNINFNNMNITNLNNLNDNFHSNKRIQNDVNKNNNIQKNLYGNYLNNNRNVINNNDNRMIGQKSQKNMFQNLYKLANLNKINKMKVEIKSLENDYHIKRMIQQGKYINKIFNSKEQKYINETKMNKSINNDYFNNYSNNKIKYNNMITSIERGNNQNNQILNQNKTITIYKKIDINKPKIKTIKLNKYDNNYRQLNNQNINNTKFNIKKNFILPMNNLDN